MVVSSNPQPLELRPFNVLLADDGSQHALSALAMLCDLPLPFGSRVTVLGVLNPRDINNHSLMEAALDQAQDLLECAGLEVETSFQYGAPAEKIIALAGEIRPDLIVMGARGLRATLGILLGGVAQQVVEYADWPVLVVRAPYPGLQHVLLATDGSEYSQRAVEYLCRFPLPANVHLHAMHVLPPLFSSAMLAQALGVYPEVTARLPSPQEEEFSARQAYEEECAGQRIVDEAIETIRSAGRNVDRVLVRGDAATEIIEFARSHHATLIVTGSRGLTPIRGWLLGSVSRKLVHYAGCAVLVVKG